MSCPSCGHENPAGARFCNDCGARLAASATTLEPRSYTPRHLVEKILASKSALEGERKPVTVLFADVARSMELAERVDPEEWHRLLDRLFRILADGVHRYEGTINQYTGDGIMALFGAPIAHEDHAQRACAAALDLARELGALAEDVRRESGLDFAVRMGLNSGEVVVGRIGDDLRMDYTAQGHVVGLAARVQQLAPPGGVSMTEQTARLAVGLLRPPRPRGAEPQGRERSRAGVRPAGPGPDPEPPRPFTRAGLLALRRPGARARAAREGSARGAVRSTEGRPDHRGAGRGKEPAVSRVRRALPRRAAPLCPRALPRTHAPLSRHRRAGARSLRRPPRRFGGGRPRCRRRGLASAQPVDPIALAFWLELLGAPDPALAPSELEPQARRARLFQSLRRSDPGSRSTRAHVALDRGPALARPGERSRAGDAHRAAPSCGVGRQQGAAARDHAARVSARVVRTGRASLAGAPRPPGRLELLLDDWLGSDPALAPLRARIEARARGNPLFVEEIVRSLVERGALRGERGAYAPAAPVEEIALPETVQAVLASRIDRLSHARQGRAPGRGGGRPRGADRSCCASWSIFPDPISPRRSSGSRRLSFSVPRGLRVSAPSGIPSRRRWPTARSFWTAGVGRTAASRERCSRSTDPRPRRTPRSSPITSRRRGEHLEAARWHEHAGRRGARSDPADGVRHCRRVTQLLAAIPESRETLMLELTSRIALLEIGRIAGIEEREAQGLFEEARAVAERLGDRAATRSCSRPTDVCAGSRAT